MNKIIPFLCIVALVSACAVQQREEADGGSGSILVNKAVESRIDSALKSLVDEGRVAGVSALVYEKNREVYFNAFGYADREAKKPMDRNTIVRIFSMTKPITGVALMTLYEKGKFQLDDPLSKYAPEFTNMKVFKGVDKKGNPILEPAARPITIRDITRHTAGFAGADTSILGKMVKAADAMNKENTLEQMAKKLASLPLAFDPGTQWAYGPSVDVQAYLVEKLSGKPFDQYVKETILDPLKMEHTRYLVAESNRPHFAALYNRSDDGTLTRVPDEQANSFNTKEWALKPGGFGLTSTLDDYMVFAQMLVNGGRSGNTRILKPETVKLMATSQLSDTISKRMWL